MATHPIWRAGAAGACVVAVALECVALAGWQGWLRAPANARPAQQLNQATVAAPAPGLRPELAAAEPVEVRPEDSYYAQLRSKIRWVETSLGGDTLLTPDLSSRMLLAKSAARRAGLNEVGLGFQDVYGIINAETSWVPRSGVGKNGIPSLGVAQFEPATARALGLRDPNDLVEAVHVAAVHMKEAALWSADRIARLNLGSSERAAKLREGVSIYYNLSSRGRSVWNGKNTRRLPTETRLHIQNARIGAEQAVVLEARN
jgi:hypothetical protein